MGDFQGAGGPPPSKGGGGNKKKLAEFGFDEQVFRPDKEGKVGPQTKRIFTWRLKPSEKGRSILLLDKLGERRSVYIHGPFKGRDGLFGSMLASPFRTGTDGDPLNEVLKKEPTWYWALTGIDLKPWKNEKTGKLYFSRVLVLVTDRQKSTFLTAEKMGSGLRGHVFNVNRDKDTKSYRIGTEWDFVEKLTEEQMVTRFGEAARVYGLPIDAFLSPFDYEAMFEPKSHDVLMQLAKDLAAVAQVSDGVQLPGEEDTSDEAGGEVPF